MVTIRPSQSFVSFTWIQKIASKMDTWNLHDYLVSNWILKCNRAIRDVCCQFEFEWENHIQYANVWVEMTRLRDCYAIKPKQSKSKKKNEITNNNKHTHDDNNNNKTRRSRGGGRSVEKARLDQLMNYWQIARNFDRTTKTISFQNDKLAKKKKFGSFSSDFSHQMATVCRIA